VDVGVRRFTPTYALNREVVMKNFYDFLRRAGGMHDATVTCITWLPNERRIEFCFEDIYWNFEGLPEYPVAQSGTITLNGVSYLDIDLETDGPLRISDFSPDEKESDVVLITFWSGSGGKIRVKFSSADYPSFRLKTDV
jgi:hypothetical protein